MDVHDGWLVAGWATLHLLGMTAAWISRWQIGRRVERANHLLLAAAFLAIAGLAVTHSSSCYHLSLLSGATLACMAVGAVCDFRHESENRVLTQVMAAYES